jgi:predicted ATP-grasp superfamily ATP-dependent carboligase
VSAAAGNGRRGTILVTDAGRSSALAVIRSLGRRGWRVVAADPDPGAPGLRSRYARVRALYPSPAADPARCLAAIERIVERHGVELVIPATDQMVHVLAAARKRFEPRCRLAIDAGPGQRTVMDKWATLRLADGLGVPIPASRLARTIEEARRAAEALHWPVVLKSAVTPVVDGAGRVLRRPVCYAAGPADLEKRFPAFEGGPVLLQEFCPGRGCGVEMLADRGRPVAAFQHRRLAEVPTSGGASAVRESVPLDPLLLRYASSLVEALGWSGLIMVEFKVGPGVRLMEINGRVWGSMPLAVAAGMDFPARLADLLLRRVPAGSGIGPAADYRAGVQACNLELTAVWFTNVLAGRRRYPFLPHPRRRDALRALGGLITSRAGFDTLSTDDPRPGLAEIGRIPAKLFGKVALALRPGAPRGDGEHDDG